MEPNITAHYVSFLGSSALEHDGGHLEDFVTAEEVEERIGYNRRPVRSGRRGESASVLGFPSYLWKTLTRTRQGVTQGGRKYRSPGDFGSLGWRMLFLLGVACLLGVVCLLTWRGVPAVPAPSLLQEIGSPAAAGRVFKRQTQAATTSDQIDQGASLRWTGTQLVFGESPGGSFPGVRVTEEVRRAQRNNRQSNDAMDPFGGFFVDLNKAMAVNDTSATANAFRPPLIWMWAEQDFVTEFNQFVGLYTKNYQHEDEAKIRYRIFKKNMYFIHTHNEQGHDYSLKMNKFGDLTYDEFKAKFTGYRKHPPHLSLGVDLELLNVSEEDVPSSVDWRQKGCVTEIKDQKDCGSCWAFSTTGSIEGAVCAQTGILHDLSEQQLVDCAGPEGNDGCNGGDMDWAFQYVIDNHGLCSEKDYPYRATQKTCRAKKCTNVVHIEGYRDVPKDNELALRKAVATYGPIAIGIEADQPGFQFYHSGVFGGACGDDLDHGVVLVGYGKDAKTHKDYWEVKNSWGTDWGETGYIQLAMHKGKEGECGILLSPSYPVTAVHQTQT